MNKRIAFAVEELDSNLIVADHFGGCSQFHIFEIDENNNIIKEETYFNPLAGEHGGTCQLPGYVNQFNISSIIAGGMGQKAVNNFINFGIEVITAPGVSLNDAFKLFIEGKISGYNVCAHEHGHGNHHHN